MEISNRISAEIIADSINKQGDRITTYVLTFPRIVLAEFNTHRAISKNSASSRAIPFKTMVQKVMDEPFIPIAWQKDHKGMQGIEYYTDQTSINNATKVWLSSRDEAVKHATALSTGKYEYGSDAGWASGEFDYGVNITKQLCNRMLEPYMYHTVICTGTDWENFFALRAHPDAEIHIADLAEKMLVAYNESTPKLLQPSEWHIPFGDNFDLIRLNQMVGDAICSREEFHEQCARALADLKVKIATARCARVSYLNFEGKDDYKADIILHNRLLEGGHMSPFEHCARAMTLEERYPNRDYTNPGYSGNFKGFVQYRKTITGENKSDSRVIKWPRENIKKN